MRIADAHIAARKLEEWTSSRDVLEQCKGGNTQNDNESYNGLLWHFAPKHLHNGLKTIELVNFLAVSIVNDGFYAILKILQVMDVIIGPIAKEYAMERDGRRIKRGTNSSEKSLKNCIKNCKQLFSLRLAFTTQIKATHTAEMMSVLCIAIFWVVNASSSEKKLFTVFDTDWVRGRWGRRCFTSS